MLGSWAESDDAVQEAWLRLTRADASVVDNLTAWLTTVIARVCLDMLRSRKSRREEQMDSKPRLSLADAADPADEAILADSIGEALLIVLDTLTPPERLAFVLHDMFDVPFDEIAGIVHRTPAAARQLASRARRRVRGARIPDRRLPERRRVVEAFLAASRAGDFDALLALLHPDVAVTSDEAGRRLGPEPSGKEAVARTFRGRAHGAELAMIDGQAGLIWAPRGHLRVAFVFKVQSGLVVAIRTIADRAHLSRLRIEP
jgi:RNA polymerase sigma-70 factor (ECF subfamily)